MKKMIVFLMMVLLAACQTTTDAVDRNVCVGDNCEIVKFSMPNGNDLVLETSKHVIHIEAQPDVKYGYYVWTGDNKTTNNPDLIVEDGKAMVLVEE